MDAEMRKTLEALAANCPCEAVGRAASAALAEIDRLTEQILVSAGERHLVYQGGITDAPETTLDAE